MDASRMKSIVDSTAGLFEQTADRIWDHPELNYREYECTKIQQDVMRGLGFEITAGIAGIETAFVASSGSGSPIIAILGEFDALPGLSQKAGEAVHDPVEEGAPGHGCGHNILGTAAMRAAASLKTWMDEDHIAGTIRYYGCPAEEGGSGKAFMVREGCFDDVDVAFCWHPALNNVTNGSTLASMLAKVSFSGKPAHAAQAPEMGRSALDAAELMNVGVQFLREHVTDDVRIHYAFKDAGGSFPNIVQDHVVLAYQVRAETMPAAKAVYDRVAKIAQGAAMMTETSVEMKIVNSYANVIPNKTLSKVVQKNLEYSFPLDLTDEEVAYAQRYFDQLPQSRKDEMAALARDGGGTLRPVADFISKPTGKVLSASSDAGDVSWVVPMGGFDGTTCALGTSMHSWQMTAQGKSSIAYKGMAAAALTLALSAADVFEDTSLIGKAKADLEDALDGGHYTSVIPADVKPGEE